MKKSVLLTTLLSTGLSTGFILAGGMAGAEQSLSGGQGGGGALGVAQPMTSMPQAGTSAGSPQTAGPLNSAPNGMGGTYGYPNSAVDPNTVNPGLPQQPYYSGQTDSNVNTTSGSMNETTPGTSSGTTTSLNPTGAPLNSTPIAPAGSTSATPSH